MPLLLAIHMSLAKVISFLWQAQPLSRHNSLQRLGKLLFLTTGLFQSFSIYALSFKSKATERCCNAKLLTLSGVSFVEMKAPSVIFLFARKEGF